MALNLVRNSRVFFTTDVAGSSNTIVSGSITAANTYEIQVLDGFSFSQNTNQETVTINEAGSTPNRGSRAFNTSLAPVEFSFTTYMRPDTNGTAEERHLWAALLGAAKAGSVVSTPGTLTSITRTSATLGAVTLIGTAFPATVTVGGIYTLDATTNTYASEWNSAIKITTYGATTMYAEYLVPPHASAGTTVTCKGATAAWYSGAWSIHPAASGDTQVVTNAVQRTAAYNMVSAVQSNINTFLPFGLAVVIDSGTYLIDNCAMNSAQIDFGLDGIASIQWSGFGTVIRSVALTSFNGVTMSGGLAGTHTAKVTTASFITNKVSTLQLWSSIRGTQGTQTKYNIALTGGSVNINNNINYVTPAIMGVVNSPIGYYAGGLQISGSINAYLHAGTTPTNNTGDLLSTLLTNAATASETKYRVQIDIGGQTATKRVEFECPATVISLPTVETQQIVSTTINFNAQAFSNTTTDANAYEITQTNPLFVKYFG